MQQTLSGFNKMDNVSRGGIAKGGVVIPGLVVNATQDETGKLVKRPGRTLSMSIASCHSLYTCQAGTFCMGDNVLYKLDLDASTKTALATLPTARHLNYEFVNNMVFLSNREYCKVYENSALRTWGQVIDDMDSLQWITEDNGSTYFLAGPDGKPTATIKPYFHVHKPDPMNHIVFSHGRMWGAREEKLFFSDAMSPEWWQDDINVFEFDKEILMVADSAGGLFIGFEDKTICLQGTDPAQMVYIVHDIGVMENTLQYGSGFEGLGNRVPMWGTDKGIVAGTPDGNIVNLTIGTLRYDVSAGLASFYRLQDGKPQYGMVFSYPDTAVNADPTTKEIVDGINSGDF